MISILKEIKGQLKKLKEQQGKRNDQELIAKKEEVIYFITHPIPAGYIDFYYMSFTLNGDELAYNYINNFDEETIKLRRLNIYAKLFTADEMDYYKQMILSKSPKIIK